MRVVLRDLDKALASEAANALPDPIYRALHQGTAYRPVERDGAARAAAAIADLI